MSDPATLTPEGILDTAEDVLRRFGPAKTTVVDVARALGVSHGAIYRHFPSKSALRDAVTERWLARVSAPLRAIADENGPADRRLRDWFDSLIAIKRAKVTDDPELFATYNELAGEAREVVARHVAELTGQIARILDDGRRTGVFAVDDPERTARALFQATARFHHPVHAHDWSAPTIDADFEAVWTLIVAGLKA